MSQFGSIGTVIVRAASLAVYVGTTLTAVSEPACRALELRIGGLPGEATWCLEIAGYEIIGILTVAGLLVACAFLFLPFSWREAVSDMGNVAEGTATHGLRRAIRIRDTWRALRREAILMGLIVGGVVASHAGATDVHVSTAIHSPIESWDVHLKLGGASILVIVVAVILQPMLDFVPHVARWLKRRTFMGGRSSE